MKDTQISFTKYKFYTQNEYNAEGDPPRQILVAAADKRLGKVKLELRL